MSTATFQLRELADIVSETELSVEGFSTRFGDYFLVGAPIERDGGGEWSFRTASHEAITVPTAEGQLLLQADFIIYALRKDPTRPFATTILIGRSRSNDIVLDDPSVSKLHARLERQANHWGLSDAGSSNGTRIHSQGGIIEIDGAASEIQPDQLVQLGDCFLSFVDASRLVRACRLLA